MPGPLNGIRVVDMTMNVMGPYAAQILGDMGADVCKIEPPEGDALRGIGPSRHKGMGPYFLHLNRNKRSLALDMKKPGAREVLLRLLRQADVLLYSFRPKAMERFGASYAEVSAVNPRIVYCGAFGFGQDGPFSRRGGRAGPGGGDDIFSQLFGEAFRERGAGGGRTSPRRRGEDVSATHDVTHEEVAGEAKKRVALPGGREIDVVIPKGLADRQTIRLRGLGQEGGGGPGDALLTIRILPHPRFTPEGQNLRVRVPVELDEAVLGGTVRVPTLTGAVDMAIPPMTSSGRTLRLRGKGLPGKAGRGDLLAIVEIRLPEKADEALLDYARRLRSEKAV